MFVVCIPQMASVMCWLPCSCGLLSQHYYQYDCVDHISSWNGLLWIALTGIESHMIPACYKTLYYLMLISEGGLFQGNTPSEYCRDWRFCSHTHNVVREPCSLCRRLVEGWTWELRSDVNKYIMTTAQSTCMYTSLTTVAWLPQRDLPLVHDT